MGISGHGGLWHGMAFGPGAGPDLPKRCKTCSGWARVRRLHGGPHVETGEVVQETARWLVALAAAGVAAEGCRRRRLVTGGGAVAAAALGGAILRFGGLALAVPLALDFVLTGLLSRLPEAAGGSSAMRGARRVVANGAPLALLAAAVPLAPGLATPAFLGALAAVAGDTWATEIGRRVGGAPRSLRSGARVPPGTPGAVTGVGIAATALAGAVTALAYLAVRAGADVRGGAGPGPAATVVVAACLAGGVGGALADGVLGATCQAIYRDAQGRPTDRPTDPAGRPRPHLRGWRWLDNDLVNLGGALAGGTCGAAVAAWLRT
ncbi:MAG: DUF92 domain-containing protein [Myxococcota bacterium]|nr:DUF92 domain-containing protein [Myxococcota bacterium]